MTFCIGSSNISAFLYAICRRIMQCNNASGVFSLSYAQGLWKPARALWSFHIVLLAWKTQTLGLVLCKQNPCTFKPNKSKLSHCLFWILKIMYWVCVRRVWKWGEEQGWLLWGKKITSVQLCLGSDQDRVNFCSSWEAAWLGHWGYSMSPHLIAKGGKKGESEEKGFLPDEQAWYWSGFLSILHVKSLSKKHFCRQYCCC